MAIQRSPKTIRQEKTRERIVEEAGQLLKDVGRERFSLRQVAKRVDYSPAGLYEYFASKQQLIDAVAESIVERLARALSDARLDGDDPIVDVAQAYVNFARDHQDDFLLVFGEKREDAEGFAKQVYQVFVNTVASQTAKSEAKINPARVAYRVWVGVHGLAMLQITHFGHVGSGVTPDAERDQMREFVTHLEA